MDELQSLTIQQLEGVLRKLRLGDLEAKCYTSRHETTGRLPNGTIQITVTLYDPARDIANQNKQLELPLHDH